MKNKKIILIGNPNTGKSTLFNTLTKSNEKVSNWHGVTVGVKSKLSSINSEEFEIVDTPGVYSFSAYSNEEKITINYLKQNLNEIIVNVCDANNLKRNLILTLELLKNGIDVILAVNMSAEVKNYDYKKLSKLLNISVVEIDARNNKGITNLLNGIKQKTKEKTQKSSKIIEKYTQSMQINEIFAKIQKKDIEDSYAKNDKIDKFVLNKFNFLTITFASLFLVFYLTFGPYGMWFSSIINCFFSKIVSFLRKIILCANISYIIKIFIFDCIFVTIESVISFIPQIVLLMFFISVLEDIGLMSRIAFMFDGVLKKFGLSGKSLFSLMLGFGCTTSAVITTRNLENPNLRKRTALLLPFMSCSAKLPIFLVLSSLFFEKYKYLFVLGLYLFSILISIFFACIYKKLVPDKKEILILEMPKYRKLNFKKVLKDVLNVLKEFLVKVGTLILFFSVCVWLLQNFSTSFQFLNGENFDRSILYFISDKITFLFKPLGFYSVGIVVALLLGIVAKEMVVVGLAMMNGAQGGMAELSASLLLETSICSFSKISAVVFLIFVLLYSPCISALFTIKNELGKKTAGYVFVAQFVIAYIVSFLIYHLLVNPEILIFFFLFLFVDILIYFVIKLKREKSKCWGNCNACRRI